MATRRSTGLLFSGPSQFPDNTPGPAREIDEPSLRAQYPSRRLSFVPVDARPRLRRVWAATIDYTPDHLPILGPALDAGRPRSPRVSVASAGGHGMMWGPGVSRAAADLALTGDRRLDAPTSGSTASTSDGRSRLAADPIALPFPTAIGPDGRPGDRFTLHRARCRALGCRGWRTGCCRSGRSSR